MPNPEIAALESRIAALPRRIPEVRTEQIEAPAAPAATGERLDFGDIVQQFDPTFGFRQSEAEKAANRALSARGLSRSGSALRALTELGSNLALDSSQRFIDNLSRFAGFGASAAPQLANLGVAGAGQQGQFVQNAGAARASGVLGAANVRAQNIRDLENLLLFGAGGALGFF